MYVEMSLNLLIVNKKIFVKEDALISNFKNVFMSSVSNIHPFAVAL
jgi:hypothetical protein